MTGIIEAVEKILKHYDVISNDPHEEPDKRAYVKESFSNLKKADYYEINKDLADYVVSLKNELIEAAPGYDFRMPVDARPPSEICFLYVPHVEMGYLVFWHKVGELPPGLGVDVNHPAVTIYRLSHTNFPIFIGGYIISEEEKNNHLLINERFLINHDDNFQSVLGHSIISIGLTFSLINQPRFVIRSETGTRQLRRQMNRGHGIATDAWHKIQWNLNEPVVEKDKGERGGWHLPLHYTRGHWRRGQPHWENIVIRKDGLPYKWIEGFWSGHPAYGFKKSYHAPTVRK